MLSPLAIMRCSILLFCATLIGTIVAAQNEKNTQLPTKTGKLSDTFASADRLVVTHVPQNLPADEPKDKVLFEFRGQNDIAELINAIKFEDDEEFGAPCLCYGTHNILLYKGTTEIGLLNYKHFSRIAERDLTSQSKRAFAAWFAHRGFVDFQNGVEANLADLRKKELNAKRAAELFPKKYRSLIPDYTIYKIRQQTKESENPGEIEIFSVIPPEIEPTVRRVKTTEMLREIDDRVEFMKSCLRSLAVIKPDDQIAFPDSEPLATFYYSLDTLTSEEFINMIKSTADSEFLLLEGALIWIWNVPYDFKKTIPDAILAKIYSANLSYLDKEEGWRLLLSLKRESGPECLALRLKIASSGQPRSIASNGNPETIKSSASSNESWLKVLLDLAEQKVPEAHAIVINKLQKAPDGYDKLALEVALACYDESVSLGSAHFSHPDYWVSTLATKCRKSAK